MIKIKKIYMFIISLGSSALFAGTMGPVCSAVNVTTPCENVAWDLGGRALYMRAGNGFEGFSVRGSNGKNNTFFSNEVNPNWGWGFQLEGSYHYSTGNDFTLNWYHYRSGQASRTLTSTEINVLGGNVIVPVTLAGSKIFPGSSFSNSPSWDQVNMEFGQHVDFGKNKFARLHAGMNFSRVGFKGNQALIYANTVNDLVPIASVVYNNSTVYNGFGPRVGLDLNYEWVNGFAVHGTGALSVLAGTNKYSRLLTNYSLNNSSLIGGKLVTSNLAKVVGEFDAKLGFMYNYSMTEGDLSLDIGWSFAEYRGALNTSTDGRSATPNLLFGDVVSLETDNFGIQGLYFGMKWIGNFA